MTFHPHPPTTSWSGSLPAAGVGVFQFDCFVKKCDIESVQRTECASRTQCQSSLNLDSSSQPVQSALNTHLTSCDRWHWSLTILPISPNRVGGIFSASLNRVSAGNRVCRPATEKLESGIDCRLNKAVTASFWQNHSTMCSGNDISQPQVEVNRRGRSTRCEAQNMRQRNVDLKIAIGPLLHPPTFSAVLKGLG